MNEETTAVLVDALSDPAAEVRKTAAEEARHHDAAQLDEELRTHLETETDEQVVFALRRALDAF